MIRKGTLVRLKKTRRRPPQTAKVIEHDTSNGCVIVEDWLDGHRYWHIDDLKRAPTRGRRR